MDNNSSNLNKTNNNLSTQIIEHKILRHTSLEIQVLAWNRHNKVVGFDP